ncbi:MAG TPA: DUF1800 family protein [Verrucomicrobiota bacterium]|nr:DUF1800 family protein [Verrucomicrobiota bacterium]
MNSSRPSFRLLGLALSLALFGGAQADDSPAPTPGVTISAAPGGSELQIRFHPIPAVEEYQMFLAPALDGVFGPVASITNNFAWNVSAQPSALGYFQVRPRPISDADLLATTLLYRLGYGPTPDELDRVRTMGPEAYLAEQLTAESIDENLDTVDVTPRWQKVTATGLGSASRIYLYLDGPGDLYLDDLRLVSGSTDDGTGVNLLRNGGFESALGTTWNLSPNMIGTARSSEFVHSGAASLHLVATEAGETQGSSVYQVISPNLNPAQTYTLSYWYQTSTQGARLTIRLSGGGITSNHDLSGSPNNPATIFGKLQAGNASRADLRAWHVLRAIQSRRQLHEVLRQFLENHFVTQVSKTQDLFDNRGYDNVDAERLAVRTEFVENVRWRQALLNPNVTFYDLLTISAESPAMIVYLDSVTSRGDGSNIANENYARELCELFCFGVDNGYDQHDIVQISRAWSGWRLELLAAEDEFNPLARRSTNYVNPSVTGAELNANTNVIGVWSFKFRTDRHNNSAKYLFYEWDASGRRLGSKKVPARFGPPWAGKEYAKFLPARSGNLAMQDGYDLLRHMADQPFTQEYISVKLCRLFVHDGFRHGYDFTDDLTSPEEELVKQCMLAWENSNPKGQLREVLKVIFNSELFRHHEGSLQKAKTPLEFAVSTIRALRARLDDGQFTAETDGYSVYNFMNRAGRMRLFDRAEPDGYPEDAPGWISAGTLAERLRFVQSALMPQGMTGKDDAGPNTKVDVFGLLQKRIPSAPGLRDPTVVAHALVGLLFPAEGTANLAKYREVAVNFLNTADDGIAASPFANLAPGTPTYDQRVRGLIGLLLSTQRFQEQ